MSTTIKNLMGFFYESSPFKSHRNGEKLKCQPRANPENESGECVTTKRWQPTMIGYDIVWTATNIKLQINKIGWRWWNSYLLHRVIYRQYSDYWHDNCGHILHWFCPDYRRCGSSLVDSYACI